MNGIQLAGFFHGQFVLNDAFFSGLGLAFYDLMKGKPVRAARELVVGNPISNLYRGAKIYDALRRPGSARQEWLCHLPFSICHLPFAICHLPSAICHLPFAICHLSRSVPGVRAGATLRDANASGGRGGGDPKGLDGFTDA